MAARIRISSTTKSSVGVIIERLADGLWYDGVGAFVAAPAIVPIPESKAVPGLYLATLATPATAWTDGAYVAYIVRQYGPGLAVDQSLSPIPFTMRGGDDTPVPPVVFNLPSGATIVAAPTTPSVRPV